MVGVGLEPSSGLRVRKKRKETTIIEVNTIYSPELLNCWDLHMARPRQREKQRERQIELYKNRGQTPTRGFTSLSLSLSLSHTRTNTHKHTHQQINFSRWHSYRTWSACTFNTFNTFPYDRTVNNTHGHTLTGGDHPPIRTRMNAVQVWDVLIGAEKSTRD